MKSVKRPRVYADTSVFGGCFDAEFKIESEAFFREVGAGKFLLLIADVTIRELALAPDKVRKVLASLDPGLVELISLSEEIERLRDAYLQAGVLGPASVGDAEHIASASIAGADLVVSWNFKHIVHFEKIAGFEAVNLMHGYRSVRIYSPKEVVTL